MCCMCVMPFIRGFLHRFNVDLVDTVQAFKAAARLMCPATAPLLNPTPASFHLPQQLRAFPFLNEEIIMDGLSQEPLPAYFARAEGVSFKADRMADLAARKVESLRWRQNEDNLPKLGRCCECGSSYPAFFCSC